MILEIKDCTQMCMVFFYIKTKTGGMYYENYKWNLQN
jgi:hypothetical protein